MSEPHSGPFDEGLGENVSEHGRPDALARVPEVKERKVKVRDAEIGHRPAPRQPDGCKTAPLSRSALQG